MYVRISRSRIKPERLEEFKELMRENSYRTAKKQKGFIWAVGLPPQSDDDYWMTVSKWESKEDAYAYHHNPERNAHVSDLGEYYIEPPHILDYEDIVD